VISEPEFQALAAQGFNRIPLMAQAFADLETPLSLYLKLAHMPGDAEAPDADSGRYSFLLESVVGGERFGRYSFIGSARPHPIACQRLWGRCAHRGGHGWRGRGDQP
jgi:anthranilate synthase component 1